MQPTASIEIEYGDGIGNGEGAGTLKLAGIIDIFEADRFHRLAIDVLNDQRMKRVVLDLSRVERLDVSAVQILCALKQGLTYAGREVSIDGSGESVAQLFALLGIKL